MAFPNYNGNLAWLQERTIYLVKHGSVAYGTNIEGSDIDYKGVCIPPSNYYHGYLNHFEQEEGKDPDLAVYEIRKFFKLAADANPSIIEVLWVDEADIVQCNDIGRKLIDHRDLFLSRKARHTFSGYAISQLKRIKLHRDWLLHPVKDPPTRAEYDLPDNALMNASEYGATQSLIDKKVPISESVLYIFNKEREYKTARMRYDQYQNWLKTRNPARAAMEAKFGYDGKHALHLCRLMRMCKEILETGKVIVKRPDRDELLAIRSGEWSFDKLIEYSKTMDQNMEAVMNASPLPHSPDRNKLDALCQSMVESMMQR